MTSFSVCTYNMGSSIDDYLLQCRHTNPAWKDKNAYFLFENAEEEQDFAKSYKLTQDKTTELLTDKAAVYCLQEVLNEERALIQSLKKKKFTIVHVESQYFDSVIALDQERFTDIVNHSFQVQIDQDTKKDVAVATATDTLSRQRMTFVSAHAPGFAFENFDPQDAGKGDVYCEVILDELTKIGDGTVCVIGADMNANPEKWKPRFDLFSNKGFQLYRTDAATNVNPVDPVDKEREIDFIFTRTASSILQKIKSIFISTIQTKVVVKKEGNPIGWSRDNNASDHLPVFVEVSHQVRVSKICQLWNAIYRFVSPYFRTQQQQTA